MRALALGVLIALAACRDRPAASPPPSASAGPTVELRLDGAPVGRVSATADLAAAMPAAGRDPSRWAGLKAGADDGRLFAVSRVATTYAGGRISLVQEDRDLVLAFFRPGAGKDAAPALRFLRPTWIDVLARPLADEAPAAGIAVTLDGKPLAPIDDAELDRSSDHDGGHRREHQGAALTALVAARTPLDPVVSVALDAGDGRPLTLTGDELRSPAHEVRIRRNQKGVLRVKHSHTGVPAGDLRGLISIAIRTSAAPPPSSPPAATAPSAR